MRWNHSRSVCSSRSVSRQSTGSWNRQSGWNAFRFATCAFVSAIGLLDVERHAVDCEGGFADRLAEGRMRMDVAADLPGIAPEQLRQRRLGDQLGGLDADHVGAQQLTGLRVR